MRKCREFSQRDKASVRTAVNPTALPVAVSTLAGVAIEAPVAANDGVVGRWRVDTTDALYTTATDYRIAWTATIAGNTFTRTLRYRHVTGSLGVTPGAPTVGVSSVTDTTATFTNVLGTNAVATLITLTPAKGGPAISVTGAGAYIIVPGMTPGAAYYWSAQGVSTTGAQSGIGAGNLGTLTTTLSASVSIPAHPILVKFWFRNRATLSAAAPRYVDADRVGHAILGSSQGPLGQSENMRLRLEIHHPVWPRINSITVRGQVKDGSGTGMLDPSRINDGS